MGNIVNKTKKPVYNYNIKQCNQLIKKGVFPIGVGVHNKTGNVFHVFIANKRYFDVLELIQFQTQQDKLCNV